MPDHGALRGLRRERDALDAARHALGVDIHAAESRLTIAARSGTNAQVDAVRLELDRLRNRRSELTEKVANVDRDIEDLRDGFDPVAFPGPDDRLSELSAALPIALLPVRIETRFLPHSDQAATHLWIRIYPDDVHVDAHEPELTANEIVAAKTYWAAVTEADGDPEVVDAAWARLAELFEPNRAEWILHATRPGPDGVPRLDDVPRKDGPWTRAPVARALPERFVALGYVAGQRVFAEWGEHVVDRLPVGPQPDLDADDTVEQLGPPPLDQTELLVDEELRWLIDVEEARSRGMAIAVELRPKFANGLDRLLVLGVRAAEGPEDDADLLEALLSSHRFTEGLAVLRPGAPTNNTATDRSAATSTRPGTDPLRTATTAGPETVGAAAAVALGIEPSLVADLEGADRVDHVADMHDALWPATLGYYSEQLLLPLLTDRTIDQVREHFRYVRGQGPLPTLRIGAQPYGLLPVMAPGRLRPSREDISGVLETGLGRIRGFWSNATGSTPRVGRTDDPVKDLIEVLGMAATTQSVEGRPVVGRHLLENLFRHGATTPISEGGMEAQRAISDMLLSAVGVTDRTVRLATLTAIDTSYPIRRPFVGRGRLSETEPAAFVAAIVEELGHSDTVNRIQRLPKPRSLLELLLRHAALVAMGTVATSLNLRARKRPSRVLMEAEFVDVETDAAETATALRLVDRAVDGVTDGRTVADVIATGGDGLQSHLGTWGEFRTAVERLVDVPAAELHRQFAEILDVLSYRLDAWYTSLATRRLESLRAATPTGLHLGAFGFVEDLQPSPPDTLLVADDGRTVVGMADNAGFVHAPSLAHASTAAILRSGFLAHGGGSDDVLALDLTSARVRRALELIRGVRQGERLNAVVGYRIERALREQQLGQYIRPLRTAAPLVVDVAGAVDAVEAAIAGTVVDGERVAELAEQGLLFGGGSQPFAGDDPNRPKVEAAIADAADVVDALADVLLAESVHQTVRGDKASASAALAAVDYGSNPPDPDVAHTPRSAVGLTHRVAVVMDPGAGPAPGWPVRPRSLAEPAVDRWAGSLLGPPSRFRIQVAFRDAAGTEIGRSSFKLSDVGVAAADVISGLRRGSHGELNELEARLIAHAAGSAPAGSVPALRPERDDDVAPDEVSLAELLLVAEQIADVVASSQPTTGADLANADEADVPEGIDLAELRHRADSVEASLRAAVETLRAAAPDEIEFELLDLADFGIPGAVPLPGEEADAAGVLAAADGLLTSLDAMERGDETLVDRIEFLFGGTLRVMPPFVAANSGELASSRAQSFQLQNGDPLRATAWLGQMGLVREGTERLARTWLLCESITGGPNPAELRVVQLPHVVGDRWAALEYPDEGVPAASLALVMHDPDDVDYAGAIAGFVVDEWVEMTPRGSEITGLTFHYDQPDAAAPNAILIGVHPGDAKTWDLGTLEATVLESLDLAQMRAVDTDELQWVGRFLPLLYFPDNLAGDTAAVDLLQMVKPEVD